MSFRCVLTIMEHRKGEPREQLSPLCFRTDEECLGFGRVIFEPPQSVLDWRVEKTTKPVNAIFKKGKAQLNGR